MRAAAIRDKEEERLEALHKYRVLDSASEPMFDDITRLAASICGTARSYVTLVDRDRLWIKSRYDVKEVKSPMKEMPRNISFCSHAIQNTNMLEITDALKDERFYDNPLVTGDSNARFYAGVPLTTEDGHALGSLCVIDHSPRTLTEAQRLALEALSRQVMTLLDYRVAICALESKRERFDRLFDALSEAVFLLDEHDVVLDLNNAGAQLVDSTKTELIGNELLNWLDRVVNEDDADFDPTPVLTAAAETGQTQRGTLGLYRKLNGFCWVSYTVVRLPAANVQGKANLIVTFREITATKAAELELRKMSALRDIILEQAHLAVIAGDVTGMIYLFNQTAEKLTGYSADEVIGQHSFDLFLDPSDSDEKTGERTFIRHHQGHRIPVAISEAQLTDDLKKPVGQVWLMRDLADTLRLEQSVERQRIALVNGAKMASLGEMAGSIAHEINNPVAIICASAEDLKIRSERGRLTPEDLTLGLTKINDTAIRISKIVKGLRFFSRDAEQDPFVAVRVKQIVDETLGFCQKRFQAHNVQLSLAVNELLSVRGRPPQISQVLLNLLGNAFDATEGLTSRWVTLSAKSAGSKVEIAVINGGPPIPENIRERMMTPFFTTKEIGKGTGLGLSISREIVDAHGGRFYYKADAPNTTFVVELPAAPYAATLTAG